MRLSDQWGVDNDRGVDREGKTEPDIVELGSDVEILNDNPLTRKL
jgi:hypothetical protein